MSTNDQPNKMWSGRFREPLNRTFEQWQRSLQRSSQCALAVLVVFGLLSSSSKAQFRCPQDHQPATDPRAFIIGYRAISMPIGAILLIRHGHEIGAIHLTSVEHDTATKPRDDEWIGTISVETFYRSDGRSSLATSDTLKAAENLTWGRYKGVGFHYSWQSGNNTAVIGPWRFRVSHLPSQVLISMSTFSRWDGDQKDRGFEFAPTFACDISELNIKDPQLKWYPFNNGNSRISLALSELPGRKLQPSGTKE